MIFFASFLHVIFPTLFIYVIFFTINFSHLFLHLLFCFIFMWFLKKFICIFDFVVLFLLFYSSLFVMWFPLTYTIHLSSHVILHCSPEHSYIYFYVISAHNIITQLFTQSCAKYRWVFQKGSFDIGPVFITQGESFVIVLYHTHTHALAAVSPLCGSQVYLHHRSIFCNDLCLPLRSSFTSRWFMNCSVRVDFNTFFPSFCTELRNLFISFHLDTKMWFPALFALSQIFTQCPDNVSWPKESHSVLSSLSQGALPQVKRRVDGFKMRCSWGC